jgi:hypothetical protein
MSYNKMMSYLKLISFRMHTGINPHKLGYLNKDEQIKEMARLQSNATKYQTAKLRATKRKQWLQSGSLVGLFCVAFLVVGFYGGLFVYLALNPQPAIAQTVSPNSTKNLDHPGRCATLNGKQICDGSSWQNDHGYGFPDTTKSRKLKAPKLTHVECSDDVYEECNPNNLTGAFITSADGYTYPEGCTLTRRCKTLKGPATKFTIVVR